MRIDIAVATVQEVLKEVFVPPRDVIGVEDGGSVREFPHCRVRIEPPDEEVEAREPDRVAVGARRVVLLAIREGHVVHVIGGIEPDAVPAILESDV